MAAQEKKLISFFREELRAAHGLLEGTVGKISSEEVHWIPPGVAPPIGAIYAHVVLSEDATVNGLFRGQSPLFAGSWGGLTGASELQPMPDPRSPGFPDWSGWSRRVKIDLGAFRKYAQAVYTATDEFLLSLSDPDLDRSANLALLGLGEATWGYVLINGVLGNALTHTGEISCLKGLQGERGYPF